MTSNNQGPLDQSTEKARLANAVRFSKNREERLREKERRAEKERAAGRFKSQQDRAFKMGRGSVLSDPYDERKFRAEAIELGGKLLRGQGDPDGRDDDSSFDGRLAELESRRIDSRSKQEQADEEERDKFIKQLRANTKQPEPEPKPRVKNYTTSRAASILPKNDYESDGRPSYFKGYDEQLLSEEELKKFESEKLKQLATPRDQRLKKNAITVYQTKSFEEVKGKLDEDRWIKGKIYFDAKSICSDQTTQAQENLLKLSEKKQSFFGRLSFGNPIIGIKIDDNNTITLTKENLNLLLDQMKENGIDQVDNSKDVNRVNASQVLNTTSVGSKARTPSTVKSAEFNKDQFLKNTDNILNIFNADTRKQFEKIDSLETIPNRVLVNGKFQTISEDDFRDVAKVYNEKLSEHVTSEIMGYRKLDELFSPQQQQKLAQSKNSNSPPSIKCRCNQPNSYNSESYTITPNSEQYSKILNTFKEKNLKEKGSLNQALEVYKEQTPEVQKQIKSHTTFGGRIKGVFGMHKIPEIKINNRKVDLDKKTYKKFLENYQKELEEKNQSKGQEQVAQKISNSTQQGQGSTSDSSKVSSQDSQLSDGKKIDDGSQANSPSPGASMDAAIREAKGEVSSLSASASTSGPSGQGSPPPKGQSRDGQSGRSSR